MGWCHCCMFYWHLCVDKVVRTLISLPVFLSFVHLTQAPHPALKELCPLADLSVQWNEISNLILLWLSSYWFSVLLLLWAQCKAKLLWVSNCEFQPLDLMWMSKNYFSSKLSPFCFILAIHQPCCLLWSSRPPISSHLFPFCYYSCSDMIWTNLETIIGSALTHLYTAVQKSFQKFTFSQIEGISHWYYKLGFIQNTLFY